MNAFPCQSLESKRMKGKYLLHDISQGVLVNLLNVVFFIHERNDIMK